MPFSCYVYAPHKLSNTLGVPALVAIVTVSPSLAPEYSARMLPPVSVVVAVLSCTPDALPGLPRCLVSGAILVHHTVYPYHPFASTFQVSKLTERATVLYHPVCVAHSQVIVANPRQPDSPMRLQSRNVAGLYVLEVVTWFHRVKLRLSMTESCYVVYGSWATSEVCPPLFSRFVVSGSLHTACCRWSLIPSLKTFTICWRIRCNGF